MSTINTNYKATTATDYAGNDAGYYADLKARLEEALRELEEYREEYGTSLTDEILQQMGRLEVTMKAEMAALEAYGEGGAVSGTSPAGNMWDPPSGLPPEFSVPEGGTLDITQNPEDAAICDEPEAYAGTVTFESTDLNFSLQDDSISEVEVETKGKDLVLTLIYEDGSKKSWVIKDGAVRSETIIIDATTMGHSVKIDASRSLRISDGKHGRPYGEVYGFQIWGSNHDDTIYGSQGVDGIVALAGNDKIDGGAGDDVIFGDDLYETQHATEVNGVALTNENSRDDIRGGAGADQIYGGSGIDTSYASDDVNGTSPDVVRDMGGEVFEDTASAPSPDDWMTLDDNWEWEEDDDGTIVLKHTGEEGGQIDIDNMPEGYTMAMAEVDPDDPDSLIITFVGEDEDGNPQTFKMKIEGFFENTVGMDPSLAVITLNIHGSEEGDIIDFHKITPAVEHTSVNINIYGEGGNDMILGVESALVRDGIDTSDPLTSTAGERELNRVNDDDVFFNDDEDSDGYHDGYEATVEGNQIVIREDGDTETETGDTVRLVAPEGYDHGYITVGEDGYTYVVLVNDEGDTIVYKFEDSDLDYTNIFFYTGRPEDSEEGTTEYEEIDLTPVSFEAGADYGALSGGDGSDVIFGHKNSKFDDDEEDLIVEGSFKQEV